MTFWQITFRAEGDGPPVECRIRRLLKAALRAYGLRCVEYRLTDDRMTDRPDSDPSRDSEFSRDSDLSKTSTKHEPVSETPD